MVNPGCPQSTHRSGQRSNQYAEPYPSSATTSGQNNNDGVSTASVTHDENEGSSLPSIHAAEYQAPLNDPERQRLLASQPLPSLEIRADLNSGMKMTSSGEADSLASHRTSSGQLPHRTPSLRALASAATSNAGSQSPASVLSSPQLTAMGDITPLPSPAGGMSPWRLSAIDAQSLSRTSSSASRPGSGLGVQVSDSSQMLEPSRSRSRSKPYRNDKRGDASPRAASRTHRDIPPQYARNRSLSDYVPSERNTAVIPRPVAVSGTALQGIVPLSTIDPNANVLHREEYLAASRGITSTAGRPLTPPRSSPGDVDSDFGSVITRISSQETPEEIYSVRSTRSRQPRKYRKLRQLGQGVFSQVSLAVRMEIETEKIPNADAPLDDTTATPKLVAIKIVAFGPAGGADEDRVEVSLKREVEILRAVNHPSLVQLKAFGGDEKRALLVLDYCPGGDLFELAAANPKPICPALTRRIFAELVAAARYLHEQFIVHRDIKLENVLVTIPPASMEKITNWRTYDRAVVTLSDLGLSRRIPQPPDSPLLSTRCGSEDYAAPEILMGQPYDGRSTDGWALGVLLYALMENRLPFDALPGARGDPATLRARTSHRISRLEWSWVRYADEDSEWDPQKGIGMEGARECVERLLKRNTRRATLDHIADTPWVCNAICVHSGLERGDKEVP